MHITSSFNDSAPQAPSRSTCSAVAASRKPPLMSAESSAYSQHKTCMLGWHILARA